MLLYLTLACSPTDPTGADTDPADTGTDTTDTADTGTDTSDTGAAPAFADVFALLADRCAECHESSYVGEFVDRQDPGETWRMLREVDPVNGYFAGWQYVVPGDPAASLIVEKVLPEPVHGDQMPPEVRGSEPLSEADVSRIVAWIEAGAPGP